MSQTPVNQPVPQSEFSEQFVQGMRARMAVSYFKYGPLANAYPGKVSAVESLKVRLEKYAETGNTEYLIDVANFAMIEFMRPAHPGAHYSPKDSDDSPGRSAYDTFLESTTRSNSELSDEEWRRLEKARK